MFKRERSVVRGESEGKEAVQKLPLLYQSYYVINILSADSLPPGDVVSPAHPRRCLAWLLYAR